MRCPLILLALVAACSGADEAPPRPAQDPDADIKACEAVLQQGLDAPESYRRVSATREDRPLRAQAYLDLLDPALRTNAVIVADADRMARQGLQLRRTTVVGTSTGSAGAPVTATEVCLFPIVAGRMPEAEALRLELDAALAAKRTGKMIRQGLVAADAAGPVPEFPCCL